jgi:hypothetical protein
MPKKKAMWSSIAREQPKKDGKSSLFTELSTEDGDLISLVSPCARDRPRVINRIVRSAVLLHARTMEPIQAMP